jgi:hypothetical protein
MPAYTNRFNKTSAMSVGIAQDFDGGGASAAATRLRLATRYDVAPLAMTASRLAPIACLLTEILANALDESRNGHLLSYTPSTSTPGWHEINVTVKNHRYAIRARKGYQR